MYLKRLRCKAKIIGSFFTRILCHRHHNQTVSKHTITPYKLIQFQHVYSPLVCLLLTSTFFTVVFVFAAQCLCVTETSEMRNKKDINHNSKNTSIKKSFQVQSPTQCVINYILLLLKQQLIIIMINDTSLKHIHIYLTVIADSCVERWNYFVSFHKKTSSHTFVMSAKMC